MSALAAVTRPIDVQRRLVELGRTRLGYKAQTQAGKTYPAKLETFRLTSASRTLLEAAAAIYGGTVQDWRDAPDPGYFQLTTTARELDVLIPPTLASYSQAYELWDAGGCVRRCDGVTERISDQPCICDPAKRECAITTRVSVMLPRLPGLGVWRLDSHGWNAATTLPSTLELLGAAAQGGWVRAVLRAVQRSKRVREEGKALTHRWTEPQLDVAETMDALMAIGPGMAPGIVARMDRRGKVPRPALPPGPEPPADARFAAHHIRPAGPVADSGGERAQGGEQPARQEQAPPPAPPHETPGAESRRVLRASGESPHSDTRSAPEPPPHAGRGGLSAPSRRAVDAPATAPGPEGPRDTAGPADHEVAQPPSVGVAASSPPGRSDTGGTDAEPGAVTGLSAASGALRSGPAPRCAAFMAEAGGRCEREDGHAGNHRAKDGTWA